MRDCYVFHGSFEQSAVLLLQGRLGWIAFMALHIAPGMHCGCVYN